MVVLRTSENSVSRSYTGRSLWQGLLKLENLYNSHVVQIDDGTDDENRIFNF